MTTTEAHQEIRRQAAAIGNMITRLHREHYGRGATKTSTIFQRNVVLTLLEDIYTPVERTLINAGQHGDVKHTRQVFQMAMAAQFSSGVEEITGRKVIAFMSQVHFDPDIAAEMFMLEPDVAEEQSSDGAGPDTA